MKMSFDAYDDYDSYAEGKERRQKKIKAKKSRKHNINREMEDLLGKKRNSKTKKDRAFRNNQKYFEYDYEEDFYEPEI